MGSGQMLSSGSASFAGEESEIQETQRHVNVVIESFFISALFIESPAVMSEDGGNGEWCYFVSTSEAAKARRAKRMDSLSILAAARKRIDRVSQAERIN